MKYLLLFAFFLVVFWVLRKSDTARSRAKHQAAREPERMVECARCGVNQPISESVLAHGRYFCCSAHLQETGLNDDA